MARNFKFKFTNIYPFFKLKPIVGYLAAEWNARILDDTGIQVDYDLATLTPQGRWTIQAHIGDQVTYLYLTTLK